MLDASVTRSHPRLAAAFLAGVLMLPAGLVHAADADGTCQRGRYDAAARYALCQQKAMGKAVAGTLSDEKFQATASRCRVKYAAAWDKLRAKVAGTGVTCDNDRYDTTSAPGTVIDRLTGLQWERKTTDGTVHDWGNQYTWSGASGTGADGPAFTSFLATLNDPASVNGHHDWRLPTIYELQTILLEPYPCTTSPCIDQAVFGQTAAIYWASTSHAVNPFTAWAVNFFSNGHVGFDAKNATYVARAVRGGL